MLIPWRPNRHREPHYRLVRHHLEQLGWPIYTADDGSQPFSSARSYNLAAQQAGDWDIAVLHDADCWVELGSIIKAVETAGSLTYAWDRLLSLTEAATEKFHAGIRDFGEADTYRIRPPGRLPPGGPRVVTRDLWEKTGGFDPRFKGWGYEDNAFRFACKQAAGPTRRVEGVLYQLWHPRNPNDPYFARKAKNARIWRQIKHS